MKKLNYVLLLSFMLLLIAGCSKSDDFLLNEPLGNTLKKGHAQPVMVTVPFKADFTVWGKKAEHDCGEDYQSVHMQGSGTITHLGQMTTIMTFCSDRMGNYWNTDVVFVAANGDELYATIPDGIIVLNEEDNADFYSFRFNDEMYFDSGTGRFEGALGEAMTHAYVHYPNDEWQHKGDEKWHTDFFSIGELILVKGKR